MSKLLLDALKRHDLQSYYPDLYYQGISHKDIMYQLSNDDYSKLNLKDHDDKMKFMAMYHDMKDLIPLNELENNKNNSIYSKDDLTIKSEEESAVSITGNTSNKIESASKKRPFPATKHSPERNSRRMTNSFTIQRTPPGNQRTLPATQRTPPATQRTPPATQRTPPATQRTPPATQRTLPATQRTPPATQRNLPTINRIIPAKPIARRVSHLHNQKTSIYKSPTKSTSNISIMSSTSTNVSNINNDLNQRIRVCVRKRPLNKREQEMQESDIVPLVGIRTIQLNAPKTKIDLTRYTEKHTFTFDDAFDGNSSNEDIYVRTAQPLVDYIFSGGKATCFAYGQTGSGKTYTMLDSNHGLYVLAAQDIFRMLSKPAYSHLEASVGFYEIYQGQLYDLLNYRAKLTARDDGHNNIVIAGLREHTISDVQSLMDMFEYGNQERTIGITGANSASSRSHAVLQVLLKTGKDVYGKLSFIDLAGSERGVDRGDADTKTRMEGAEINKSLLALKECIRALDQEKKHTPFRGSKLTQVLRDSFTGNSRTCMIATISPNNSNSEHTLNTLRYADRVKQLKGESDPRIQDNQQLTNLVDGDTDGNSYGSWEDDENLLDEDFPPEVAANALATPTNNRFASVIEHRQEKYLKRLESPPAEVFSNDIVMEDPFLSKALNTTTNNSNSISQDMDTEMNSLEISNKQQALDLRQIRNFLKIHRNQIKQFEDCINEEKQMIQKLSFAVSCQKDEEESEQSKEAYETYLNDLDEILDRKNGYIDLIKNRIKGELIED